MGTPINKTIYKSLPQAETLVRVMRPLSTTHKNQAIATMAKFITLLKAAHS
jgi:hypothetical protein